MRLHQQIFTDEIGGTLGVGQNSTDQSRRQENVLRAFGREELLDGCLI